MYCIDDAVFFIQCKYQHRHLLFHTHDRCCQIHSCQFLCNYFFNGNFIIFYCIRVCLWITVINSVNSFCKKDCFCFDLYCAKYSGCICGEVRMSCTACKEYDLALCKACFHCILRVKACKCTANGVKISVFNPRYLQISDT